jgi:predicted DNA-binding transcriptional regulator YafY
MTDTVFTRDASFDVDTYLAGTLSVFRGDDAVRHTVRLRFTGTAVRYARERLWHPGQHVETTSDGDLVLRFEVSHLREVERLVMTWASECEAIEPVELRERIARLLAEASQMHAR